MITFQDRRYPRFRESQPVQGKVRTMDRMRPEEVRAIAERLGVRPPKNMLPNGNYKPQPAT